MTEFRRYAIYWAPPEGSALAAAGASWLGRDAATGRPVAQPETGLDLAALTETPRRYGFHATLKPPFAPARDGIETALAEFAARQAPFEMPPLRVARLGRFLALVPSGPCPSLNALAAAAVRELDAFRRPPAAEELARRRRAGLTPRQEALLMRWGYPYVMEEFRFHLTLSGPLADEGIAARLQSAAQAHFGPHPGAPVAIAEICLFGEGEDGDFRILARCPLGARPAPRP